MHIPLPGFSIRPVATRCDPVAKHRTHDADPHAPISHRFLLRYIEGWAEANASKIVAAGSEDYSFLDPLVGSFDRDSLQDYFAILKQRVGFDSSCFPQRGVCLEALATQWQAPLLRFWRSIPECGLSGTSDIEFSGTRIRREVVCYELNIATEWLRAIAPSNQTYRNITSMSVVEG
jgi:hypothetical protein